MTFRTATYKIENLLLRDREATRFGPIEDLTDVDEMAFIPPVK